jgi:1,2-diacylglycerol 3-alpha-glucosyltransferase
MVPDIDAELISALPTGNIAILFTQFGPYHHARVKALQDALPRQVFPAQIASTSRTYAWTQGISLCDGLVTLWEGTAEEASPFAVFFTACRFFRRQKIRTVFLPSYSPSSAFALYAAAVVCGCRRIMMNESHAATERSTGWKKIVKRYIVKGFHSALVGGIPQKRHFESFGLPANKIFTGYDAIDNEYFAKEAAIARRNPIAKRRELELPDRYLLNLGRFVPKKDLETLILAYAEFRKRSVEPVELVMVGSGEQEEELKALARSLGLAVFEPHSVGFATNSHKQPQADASRLIKPAVYFMGFQQISLNPSFYALADAFVLPSVLEEWGLVVNEAMACGLPVVVSRAVGCAEDLVSHNVNGLLFSPGDVKVLADILYDLASDASLRQRLGMSSIERISNWGCDRFASNAMSAIMAAQ